MWNVIGQDKALAILNGALRQGQLAHAYLLVGPKGAGKKTLAVNLAQAVNCSGKAPPCGECHSCQRISSGKHADVRIIALKDETATEEGASRKEISIDDIKQLQSDASLPPFEGRRKVFIIDGAEQLSTEASNCLLKTLEDPPPGVIFVLLSAREDRLLPTVVSRCHRIEILPLPPPLLETFLQERWGIEAGRARLLSRLSRGCPGWAITAITDNNFLEQYFQQLQELVSLEETGLDKRFAFAAKMAAQFQKRREKLEETLGLWLGWWHDLLLTKSAVSDFVSNINKEELLRKKAESYSLEEIKKMIDCLQEAKQQLEWNANPRLVLEVLMLELPRQRG
jgi:DNA polymerase-3 subunit delta'